MVIIIRLSCKTLNAKLECFDQSQWTEALLGDAKDMQTRFFLNMERCLPKVIDGKHMEYVCSIEKFFKVDISLH